MVAWSRGVFEVYSLCTVKVMSSLMSICCLVQYLKAVFSTSAKTDLADVLGTSDDVMPTGGCLETQQECCICNMASASQLVL